MRKSRRKGPVARKLERCPCCYYLTLSERGGYDICEICGWEDDGQDDETSDEVWGGPNSDLSLTQGRYNFARIGGCSWPSLRRERPSQLLSRASGFPFPNVEPLSTPPPLRSWPDSWTLSFHPRIRDPDMRWRKGVELLLKNGFRFQGTYETKAENVARWADPRFLRTIQYDPRRDIGTSSTEGSVRAVGAWFTNGPAAGAHLRFPSVFRFHEDWNEPAITIDAYMSRDGAANLFDMILQEWSVALGSCSPTSWGLQTIAEMTVDPHVTHFVHGRTYVSRSLADPSLVDGFRQRFGGSCVEPAPSGLVLVGAGIRDDDPASREVYVFLADRMRRVASGLMATRPNPKPS